MNENQYRLLADQRAKVISRQAVQLKAMSQLNHALADLAPNPSQPAATLRTLGRALRVCRKCGLHGELPPQLLCLPDPVAKPQRDSGMTKLKAITTAKSVVPADDPDRRKKLVNAARQLLRRRPLDIVPPSNSWIDYV